MMAGANVGTAAIKRHAYGGCKNSPPLWARNFRVVKAKLRVSRNGAGRTVKAEGKT